jgi:predicted RNA-binding protein with PIN domain
VRLLHDAEALRVTVVFDGRGEELSVEHPGGQPTFAHIYTPCGTTADDVIAQLVSRSRSAADCLVATDDRGERLAVEALGASSISSADLATWLARAGQRQQSRLQERRRDNDAQWRAP